MTETTGMYEGEHDYREPPSSTEFLIAGSRVHLFRILELVQFGGYTLEEITQTVYPELCPESLRVTIERYRAAVPTAPVL